MRIKIDEIENRVDWKPGKAALAAGEGYGTDDAGA